MDIQVIVIAGGVWIGGAVAVAILWYWLRKNR